MTFAGIPSGTVLFVDANPLVYRYTLHPRFGQPSVDLLDRIERQDVTGYTTSHVLGETAHRLMTLEAITAFRWPAANIGNRLRASPADVTKLTTFRTAVEAILQSRLRVLAVTPGVLAAAVALSQQIGLLTNDALIVAVMQAHGLTHLASSDTDFDRVPGLTRYGPA
ncbi:MAG TPA: type II toxin-antitoxin system VapC family toxin [Gemmataceae bacterium]|jgi:predicted nucleic acid-binding protein